MSKDNKLSDFVAILFLVMLALTLMVCGVAMYEGHRLNSTPLSLIGSFSLLNTVFVLTAFTHAVRLKEKRGGGVEV